ncbi:hypothetical protein GCM10022221_48040 [Actinocorallia aurea]
MHAGSGVVEAGAAVLDGVREAVEALQGGRPMIVVDDEDRQNEGDLSAADRARTLRLPTDPDTRPDQLQRPGHVFPLRARPGGLAERRGHTEAKVALPRLRAFVDAALAHHGLADRFRLVLCGEDTTRPKPRRTPTCARPPPSPSLHATARRSFHCSTAVP